MLMMMMMVVKLMIMLPEVVMVRMKVEAEGIPEQRTGVVMMVVAAVVKGTWKVHRRPNVRVLLAHQQAHPWVQ